MGICPFMSNFIVDKGYISHQDHPCQRAYCELWDKENNQCGMVSFGEKIYSTILEKVIKEIKK